MSADTPAQASITAAELRLAYPVLSDSDRTAIRAYNVLHPQEGLARPAVFVIDKTGTIRWSYVGQSAADRPPIEEVLARLKALQ